MAVPKFEDFLYPFLEKLKDKNMSTQNMRDFFVELWELTDDDCLIRTQGGNKTKLDDRINWTRQYLRRAKFIELPQRGVYQITERGKEYLLRHKSLKINDLTQYPEFAEFSNHKSTNGQETSNVASIEKEELTPTEQLINAYQRISNDLAEDLLRKVMEMSPYYFEHLVKDLLLKMGYGDPTDDSAQVTQYICDDGIDGIIPQDKLGLDKIYYQAKRYDKKILLVNQQYKVL